MTDTVKRSGSGLAFFALLLSFSALGAAGYLYYTDMIYKRYVTEELKTINTVYRAQGIADTQVINQLQKNINDLNSKFNSASSDKSGNVLFQVKELISLANQGLVVYNDVPVALRLLNYAKEMLVANNEAAFTGLKYALMGDIARLTALPVVDKTMLSGQIDSLAEQVASLKMESAGFKPQIIISNTNRSLWDRFIDNMKSSLSGLVRISKSSDFEAEAVLLQHYSIVQERIRVDFLSAKMALLQHDQAGWTYSLNNIKAVIAKYLAAYWGTDKLISQLDELLKINIDNPDANIDATLAQLIKLNNLESLSPQVTTKTNASNP